MKVLLIRFSSIGDIVITSTVSRAVRNKYPDAEIHFLTKENFKSLVEHSPYINQVKCLVNGKDKELIADLKSENYDLVIDLHKNLRTTRIKNALKTKWVSYDKLNTKKWLFVNFKINLLPKIHLVDRYFQSLEKLSIANDHKGLEYFFPKDFSYDLNSIGLHKKEYISIAVGGTYYTKQIPIEKLILLIEKLDFKVVLLGGGKADEQKANELADKITNSLVINLVNQLSLHESAYLIQHAKSLVTGDTGLMHIASCFDTPIETLWGNTHPDLGMYAYVSDKRVNNHQVSLQCNPCSKLGSDSCPRGHFKCMLDHNVEQVVKNCLSVEQTQ